MGKYNNDYLGSDWFNSSSQLKKIKVTTDIKPRAKEKPTGKATASRSVWGGKSNDGFLNGR
jgi:hypothetical protein